MYFEHLQKKPTAFKFGKNILINEILNFLQGVFHWNIKLGSRSSKNESWNFSSTGSA